MAEVTILNATVEVWPIVVAGAAGWIVGAVWYGVFSKPWMALAYPGKKREDLQSNNLTYPAALVAYLVAALVLAMVVTYYGASGLGDGVVVGLLVFLGFIAPTFAMNYMFGGRSGKLFLLDVGNYLASFLVMGAILGGWQ
jgi:hypothetical protein